MLVANTHIVLEVSRLLANNVYGTRFRIHCLTSNMKRFVSWNNAVHNHVADQGIIWLQSNHIEINGKSWNEKDSSAILLLDWNEQNQNLLGRIKLW